MSSYTGYRHLVSVLDTADVAFIGPGLNSLYLWSQVKMSASVITQFNMDFFRPQDQEAVRVGLESANNPVLLLRPGMRETSSTNQPDLQAWMNRHFKVDQEYRKLLVLKRAD